MQKAWDYLADELNGLKSPEKEEEDSDVKGREQAWKDPVRLKDSKRQWTLMKMEKKTLFFKIFLKKFNGNWWIKKKNR